MRHTTFPKHLQIENTIVDIVHQLLLYKVLRNCILELLPYNEPAP